MARSRTPNPALRGLLAEADWTQDELARRVNDLAAETGLVVRLDRRSVAHWLAGRRPRPPVPELVAEALSRELSRLVTVADTGLDVRDQGMRSLGVADHQAHTDLEQDPLLAQDVATVLTRLADFDDGRRQVLSGGAFSLAVLAVPAWAQAIMRRPADPHELRAQPRLQADQVATAEQMARVFSDADTAFGGGHARAALAAYLACDIAPRLHASARPALRARMFSVATQLAYLCGFMCFDDEQHPLAQRYYRAALDLAAEAGDPAAYAITLRAMSVQARTLGHHQHAVQLAETAATTSSAKVTPARQAFFLGQVAVAAAASGDRASALSALDAAERRLSEATSTSTSVIGGDHPASLAHQQAAVRALLGDRTGAITALTASIRHRPPAERRSRAITTARLAELHLHQGHMEEAVAAWHVFLEDYPHLQSGRATTALKILRSRLRPYAANPAARQLLARAAAIHRPPAG
jgi:tetratricopeptide (TPR) repeat protein